MSAVPASLAEITPDWLTRCLRIRYPDIAVRDAAVAPLEANASYNGTIARVVPTYSATAPDAPASLIAKLPPQNERIRTLGTSLGIYVREAAFYTELGSRTGLQTARLFGVTDDHETGSSAILLEDLTHLRTGAQLTGYTAAEAEATVLQYARQHAKWWQQPALERMPWLPAWNQPDMVAFAVNAYAQVWPICADAFADRLPPEVVRLGARLADDLGDLMNHVASAPTTLLHGDARHENLLFDAADERAAPVVVDWQFVARGRAMMDIACYLTQSGPPDIAAANERDLVERYHGALRDGGVADYDFDACWRDYRRLAYYSLVYPVFAAGLADPENEAQRTAVSIILERAVNALLRLDAAEFA